jgi:hypothetical protein
MKKRYTIRYAWDFDMVVTIDHDVVTDEKLHELNNFWSGAAERLADANHDVLKAVLTTLAMKAFRMTITDLDPEGQLRRGEVEGWPPLDGSEGIQLVQLDYFELDQDEVFITYVEEV